VLVGATVHRHKYFTASLLPAVIGVSGQSFTSAPTKSFASAALEEQRLATEPREIERFGTRTMCQDV
jgi:hypothetical protein